MILGITGGIATGKSTVSTMFKNLGGQTLDADLIAREVVEPNTEGLREIIKYFGEHVLSVDGTLDRKKLGEIVFSNKEARECLESILHPLIRKRMREKTDEVLKRKPPIVLWDVPLLIEKKMCSLVDKVVLVYAPKSIQVKRVMTRDHLSLEDAMLRIHAQMDIEEKRKYADFIVDNQHSFTSTLEQVEKIWRKTTGESLL